jgi:hypothetical protein
MFLPVHRGPTSQDDCSPWVCAVHEPASITLSHAKIDRSGISAATSSNARSQEVSLGSKEVRFIEEARAGNPEGLHHLVAFLKRAGAFLTEKSMPDASWKPRLELLERELEDAGSCLVSPAPVAGSLVTVEVQGRETMTLPVMHGCDFSCGTDGTVSVALGATVRVLLASSLLLTALAKCHVACFLAGYLA